MIYNRYKGLQTLYRRGGVFNGFVHILCIPIVKWHIHKAVAQRRLFSEIEIETINRCNGSCPFCPVNHNEDSRPFSMMTEELFEKIICQLSDLQYSGAVSLSSNNEPFLDKRIIQFAEMTRKKLPKAFIHMYTNGTLLNIEKVKQISPYIDRMIIDNYNDKLELNANIVGIHKACMEDKELDKKISIHLRKQNEVLSTRGGQSPNNQKRKMKHMPCQMPFISMIIRPSGEISLCCADALGKYTLGDCNRESLVQIWNSNAYQEIRKKLAVSRKKIELCRYCDMFSLS